MRVSLLTYHFVDNYGAALQAYCLQKHLQALGHDAAFIDYRPSHLVSGGSFRLPLDRWRVKANLTIGYLKARELRKMLLGDGGKRRSFEEFHRDYLHIVGPTYRSYQSLTKRPPDADAVICGSDQIWNSSVQYGIDPTYFLGFARPDQKTLSYAASFGRPSVEERYRNQVASLLGGVQAISVREASAVDIVAELTGRTATWVPDPTLLITDGHPEAVPPRNINSDYTFSYTLRSRELVAQVEQRIAQLLHRPVVRPASIKTSKDSIPGPLEWLGYIKSSQFVITNSFHGTAFSIIFRRPFVFVGLPGAKAAFNERAHSLLTRLGLEDRMIHEWDASRLERISSTEPDWSAVESKMNLWRAEANRFLQDELSKTSASQAIAP